MSYALSSFLVALLAMCATYFVAVVSMRMYVNSGHGGYLFTCLIASIITVALWISVLMYATVPGGF